ncbi:hypothetical protein M8A51_25735 [Schlegelella sp. S2-27]|uniref:Uncharacterized protein n=1 Tax=Caldimonas mangrovi TaxID=2944811 RepID=A0ABT0YX79_9BURK|nr:hypothetical protein [Caldimonas mangrovi]MCM5682939.1 hypothetical protein [Caldimonas mangrovi]
MNEREQFEAWGIAEALCLGAVDHVGLANYAERVAEAKSGVRKAFAALRDALAASPVPADLLAFLRGAAPLEGVWFGERHPTRKGAFWWRALLPAAPNGLTESAASVSAPAQQAEAAVPLSMLQELYRAAYWLLDGVCENHPALGEVLNVDDHARLCGVLAKLDPVFEVESPEDLAHLTAPAPSVEAQELADDICRGVSELPDRSSPEDWPEAMLVTQDELRRIVLAALASQAEPVGEVDDRAPYRVKWARDAHNRMTHGMRLYTTPPAPAQAEQETADFMTAVLAILNGEDTGEGVCREPWQSIRVRLIALVREQSDDGRDAERWRFVCEDGNTYSVRRLEVSGRKAMWVEVTLDEIDAAIAAKEQP